MKKLALASFWLFSITAAYSALQMPINFKFNFNSSNIVQVIWNAYPGNSYVLQTTTNLAGPWPNSPPLVATSNSISFNFPATAAAQFFKVVKLDSEGPDITPISPLNGAIAVAPQSPVQVQMTDATGVNTNSIILTIGTNSPFRLPNPQLGYADGLLTFTPATNVFLGTNGQVVTASITVADTLGNVTTNFTWSFQLALPNVLSTNIVFLGSGPSPPASLALISTDGTNYNYSYTGNSSGLSVGMQLVNSDPVAGYTVTVVSFTEQLANHTVAVVARPTLLSELILQGSLDSGGFTEVASSGSVRPLFTLPGLQLNYSYPLDQVLYQDGNLQVSTIPGSALTLNAELNVSGNFNGLSLTAFTATLQGTANLQLDYLAESEAAERKSGTITLVLPVSKTYFGQIGLVPVWLKVTFEVDAGFTASLAAQGTIGAGASASEQILFGQHWDQNKGWMNISQNPTAGFSFHQPVWQIEGSAGLNVYLLPKVTLLINGLTGITADLKPYANLNYSFQQNPPECDLSLYAGLDSDLGLNLKVWDPKWGQLPSKTFNLIPQTLLWNTNCAETNPIIVLQPQVETVVVGSSGAFEVEAQGTQPMTYQWLRGGLPLTDDSRITGSSSATLSIANAQASDAGGYSVKVSNPNGSTNSMVAQLSVVAVPDNLVLIPAGSFQMGDNIDGEADAPVHTVYVSAFYMDQTDVTEALWAQVYNWAITHGYSFDKSSSAYDAYTKGPDFPVVEMNWYDCVKWCNARSEMEGLTPAYYMSDAQTTVYRSGDFDLDNGAVNWGAGYRLPTEAEWEKAARGGLSGQRFPWGNTISWSQANYYGDPRSLDLDGPTYDLAVTYGYDPAFSGGAPYTSPVNYFAPNGYGLYDMAGNSLQWCWDWYGTYGSGSDPRGPTTGPGRVLRGGAWDYNALSCRSAFHDYYSHPVYYYLDFGFRSVLP